MVRRYIERWLAEEVPPQALTELIQFLAESVESRNDVLSSALDLNLASCFL